MRGGCRGDPAGPPFLPRASGLFGKPVGRARRRFDSSTGRVWDAVSVVTRSLRRRIRDGPAEIPAGPRFAGRRNPAQCTPSDAATLMRPLP